jgi:hypothetical protein
MEFPDGSLGAPLASMGPGVVKIWPLTPGTGESRVRAEQPESRPVCEQNELELRSGWLLASIAL